MKSFKYNIHIIAFIITGLLLVSCEDFLTVKPENNQSSGDFWKSKGDVEAVLGAGYVKIKNSQESFLVWGESRGNGIVFGKDGTDLQKAGQKLRKMEILPSNAATSWSKLYEIINMANSVLEYGPKVVGRDSSFDENSMKSFAAEAYFQRSLAYFYLVRLWGDVPYLTDPYVTDDQKYMVEQSDGEEILKKCLEDLNVSLEYAKERFEESSIDSSINSKGRATRWALYALIADINLWLGNYDECLTASDAIINSGYVGLIDGSTWFSNFYPGNSNESIYEIQYSKVLSQTNDFLKWFNSDVNYGMSTYSFMLYMESGDHDVRGSGATYRDGSTYVFYTLWKYVGINPTTARSTSDQNDQNWIMYRLADIYLMKAECYIMKGGDANISKGVDIINEIKDRAGATNTLSASSDQVSMLSGLLRERQREFVAEGKNWFDLLRVGRRSLSGCKELFIQNVLYTAGAAEYEANRMRLMDENSWYLPINESELKNNFLLVQNPYYDNLGN